MYNYNKLMSDYFYYAHLMSSLDILMVIDTYPLKKHFQSINFLRNLVLQFTLEHRQLRITVNFSQ